MSTKKVNITPSLEKLYEFENVDEYLTYTYGEKKLEESKNDRDFTHLDVVGYTLDNRGFEIDDGGYFNLEQIEGCMKEKWDKKQK